MQLVFLRVEDRCVDVNGNPGFADLSVQNPLWLYEQFPLWCGFVLNTGLHGRIIMSSQRQHNSEYINYTNHATEYL